MRENNSGERRTWIFWYYAHGRNAAATCRHFNISRSTFYRWLKRYDPARPHKPLKPLSRRPHTKRKRTWSVYHLAVLSELDWQRESRWGRAKLRVALAANGWMVSEATVGRMLQAIKRRCPICRMRDRRHATPLHIWRRDLVTTGLDMCMPLARPIRSPNRPMSRDAKEAVRQAENMVRIRGEDQGKYSG